MINSRESIMTALWAKLTDATFATPLSNGTTTWAYTSRRLKHWTDVAPSDKPALFMTEHHETPRYVRENEPGLITLDVDLFVYTDASDPNITPVIDLNIILDAIYASIAPPVGYEQRQTLGGLVSHCRVEGSTIKEPGDMDGDGLLIVPIKIMAT